LLVADDTIIIVTTCNQDGGGDERIELNWSERNGSKVKRVQYVDIWICKNFI
jgi:hypothetical protein